MKSRLRQAYNLLSWQLCLTKSDSNICVVISSLECCQHFWSGGSIMGFGPLKLVVLVQFGYLASSHTCCFNWFLFVRSCLIWVSGFQPFLLFQLVFILYHLVFIDGDWFYFKSLQSFFWKISLRFKIETAGMLPSYRYVKGLVKQVKMRFYNCLPQTM